MANESIGILSDTHDNRWALEAILSRFRGEGVTYVIHAGDFVAPFNAKYFSEWSGKFLGVFGNNDGERIGVAKQFADIGPLHVGPHLVRVFGRRFLVMHEPAALDALGRSGDFDAVIYGHTHVVDIREVPYVAGGGSTLIVNPGEAGGWLHGEATAVILNLDTMHSTLVKVPLYPQEGIV
ncbi:MAG TPA: metallophosphoesterase [Firmicutes bacterium]|nr:metallophosphoesterase [Bacillota bacterium]